MFRFFLIANCSVRNVPRIGQDDMPLSALEVVVFQVP